MKSMKRIIILFVCVFAISATGDISDIVRFPSNEYPASDVELDNAVVINTEGKDIFTLADQTRKGKSDPYYTDLLLTFNSPSSLLIKDDTHKYTIKNASYGFVAKDMNGVLGEGGARFFKSDHEVQIETARNLWLGNCSDLGSFTIEFRFCPLFIKDHSILFQRVGYFSGEKNGLEIIFQDGRLITALYKIFKDPAGRRHDYILNGGRTLEEKKWYHFALSFDRISGKLAKYINGREDEVIYISGDSTSYSKIYEPSFTCIDLPFAIIGRNYHGLMDEFRISYKHIGELKKNSEIAFENYDTVRLADRNPVNSPGIITSNVYQFPSTGTSVTLLKWDEISAENTFVWMEFRICDYLFKRDNTSIKWYRIVNNQKNIFLKKEESGFLRGKYYQWRVHLIPSPDGENAPSISNIEIHYMVDPPPAAPVYVEAVKAGDMTVKLRWKKNVEHDIQGYRIYYGIMSGKYDGVIASIEGKKITNDFSKGNYIEVEINNSIIEENLNADDREMLNYPKLINNVLYFFSVCAYDFYRTDTPYNHESAQSLEVKARPFAGSEIHN